MGKEALIAKIIDLEWNMFHEVSNIGGKASCQEDPVTFRIMRYSQAVSWAEDVLESYLTDLSEAQKNKRNLLTEKYARMMKSTSPLVYYNRIEHLLPALEPETLHLIDSIVKIVLEWEEELSAKYPNLVKRGRPIHSTEDSQFITSVETYLRGELATYSLKTLKLYYKNVLKQKSENINGSEITLNSMVKQYGYSSLTEANRRSPEESGDGP
ncbi:MAG: hypothetical protein VR68_06560 [Peptococcaceae bacterium BRH_c4a]|nr:MAG: hypothetical protein VR68_06560 [Peptococcaceae bacterium BRH_c4a]